ncbi:MAG: hypothetical protein Q9169_003157 [Polycauliona sp. 2 TL-2023]
MCCTSDILLGVLAIIFPPIAVWIKSGLCTVDSLINILLCMLGYIPGLLHAWYIIAKYPEDSSGAYEPFGDVENQHVTYYYVNDSRNNSNAGLAPPQQQQYPNQNRGYGTVQGMRSPEVQPQPRPPQQQQQQPQSKPQGQLQDGQGGRQGAGEGSSQVPPSYEQAVAGDNKIQS